MNEIKHKRIVLDNSNIAESYPGITLPLNYSFIKIAYSGIFRELINASLKDDAILEKYNDVFDNMLSFYQGRVYYCINNWYSLLDFMPFSKKIIPVWQDMMGVNDKEIYYEKRHIFNFIQRLKMNLRIIKSGFSVPRDMERLNRDFVNVKDFFDKTYNENLSITELLNLFHELKHRVLYKWYVTLSNDLYAFIWTGLLKRKLRKKNIDITKYISGIISLESMKPIKALLEIAKKYGDDADVMSKPEVREYIEVYGDRSPCELKLEVMTYRENPSLLEQKIREYAGDKYKLDNMLTNLKADQSQSMKSGFALKRARLGIQNREISRLNRSRIYGMVRKVFLSVGQRLYNDGYIEQPSDVFYLEINQIESGEYNSFKQTIIQRKEEYAGYEQLPAHSRLVFEDGIILEYAKNDSAWTGSYTGIGTSAGSVTAQAVVLHSPDEKADVKGKIIVTKTTDPGWVFLLTMASGIVAEKGSLLSHTAIVSRELSIPAVVAVENATAVIKTGDVIKIDGETGRIEIVQAD